MSERKTREFTIRLNEEDYMCLERIAERFGARGYLHLCKVEEVAALAIQAGFLAVATESYSPSELEPIHLEVRGVVAVPPGLRKERDLGGAAKYNQARILAAFPFSALKTRHSIPAAYTAAAKEWRALMDVAIKEDQEDMRRQKKEASSI